MFQEFDAPFWKFFRENNDGLETGVYILCFLVGCLLLVNIGQLVTAWVKK